MQTNVRYINKGQPISLYEKSKTGVIAKTRPLIVHNTDFLVVSGKNSFLNIGTRSTKLKLK